MPGLLVCLRFRKLVGPFENAVPWIDIERLAPQLVISLLAAAEDENRAAAAPGANGHEVPHVVAHMLLDRTVDAQSRRDLRVHRVSRPPDLALEIAPERAQIVVQHLPAARDAMGAAHAFVARQIL